MKEPQGTAVPREYVIIALYQVTGQGRVFSISDLKKMSNQELLDNWRYYSNPIMTKPTDIK